MSGLFEHLAYADETQRVASRKALALARARADRSFGNFIRAAKSVDERDARLALVAGDLEELVKQACAECDHTAYENVLATVQEHLGFVVEARRPKMCPYHREVTDISLAAGQPQAGFGAMAQHAWGPRHCQGEYQGGCNFKPEMTTQKYWDDKREQADQRRQEREQQRSLEQTQQYETPVAEPELDTDTEDAFDSLDWDSTPEPTAVGVGSGEGMSMAAHHKSATATGIFHGTTARPLLGIEKRKPGYLIDGVPLNQWLQKNSGKQATVEITHPIPDLEKVGAEVIDEDSNEPVFRFFSQLQQDQEEQPQRVAEALKTVDLDAGGETPSPKMDKRKWTPENVSFLDVEMDGSPHPTEHQDIAQPAEYGDSDPWEDDGRFDHTNAVLEKQDVEKSSNPTDGGGPATSTFPNKGQAKPVTSATDPDKNPILDLLEEEEAQRAIAAYKKAEYNEPHNPDYPPPPQSAEQLGIPEHWAGPQPGDPCPQCGDYIDGTGSCPSCGFPGEGAQPQGFGGTESIPFHDPGLAEEARRNDPRTQY